jgi:hypothetical protein
MADTKISALTASTTPLAGTEVLPIVQGGVTKQVSVANLTTGRAVSVASLTASTGNIVIGTSGQGIDFSATPGTGTSELLADYEEGTWTPIIRAGTVNFTSVSYNARTKGSYTKVGDVVHFYMELLTDSVVAGLASGSVFIDGLPFTSSANAGGTGSVGIAQLFGVDTPIGAWIDTSSSSITLYKRASSLTSTLNVLAGDINTGFGNFIAIGGTYKV